MHSQAHPDPAILDSLRAGLLDDHPSEKAALESHLAGCDSCRTQHAAWQQLAETGLDGLDAERLRNDLRQARTTALSDAVPRHHGAGLLPYATAAALLVAVALGLWNYPLTGPDSPTATATVAQTVPDIYEDLDFYLWLANQDENRPEDNDANPNNT